MADETDKSRNAFVVPPLGAEPHEQLQAAIERSKQPAAEDEWTPEDQAELNAEMARIPFDPSHANPDFVDRTITIHDEQVPIHRYNNFPRILAIIDGVITGQEVPQAPSFEATYAAVAEERGYPGIFGELKSTSPALYKRSKQIFASDTSRSIPPQDLGLSADEKALIHAQAYSAAARIARSKDPNYNLGFLCQ
jgi:hypothetical protein